MARSQIWPTKPSDPDCGHSRASVGLPVCPAYCSEQLPMAGFWPMRTAYLQDRQHVTYPSPWTCSIYGPHLGEEPAGQGCWLAAAQISTSQSDPISHHSPSAPPPTLCTLAASPRPCTPFFRSEPPPRSCTPIPCPRSQPKSLHSCHLQHSPRPLLPPQSYPKLYQTSISDPAPPPLISWKSVARDHLPNYLSNTSSKTIAHP